MKRRLWNRALSMLLVLSLLLGLAPAVYARGGRERTATFEEASLDSVTADLTLEERQVKESSEQEPDENDVVRVSIVLEKRGVLEKGYETAGIASNAAAQSYRRSLEADQQAVTARISSTIGEQLDVAWNLTLAANIISANVRYGDLEKIAETQGVAKVVLETRYEPCVAEIGGAEPNMVSSTTMTGSNLAWQAGYTGAGSRIAVIDTGLDTDHQSVDNGAYLYALEENAKGAGETTVDYMASLNLLGEEEITEVLPQLNIYKGYVDGNDAFVKDDTLTADVLHLTEKIAFAYNYIDRDLDVTHDNDGQGGHGSHVAGIAAANRYIPQAGGYAPAAEVAHTTGVAPDAQLMIMKVFGKNGGAFESDYMAAIEDAIVLGADVVNLSLGSATPGFTTNDLYQDIMDRLAQTDVVVSISAGNSYAWAQNSQNGYLYAEDVNYHTGGSPGAYANAFTVASVNNDGMTGFSFQVGGRSVVYTENLGAYSAKLASLDTEGSGTEYPYVFLDGLGKPEEYADLDVKGKVVFLSRGEITFSEKATAAANAGAIACIIYNNAPGAAINMDMSQYYGSAPCVGITQMDGNAIRAASQASDGYYTGTLTIGSDMDTVVFHSDCYTMSDFSSWGVPGNLSLKPEITTPGGNIYSIDGATAKTDQYVVMSGTSMASPHNAGLAALMAQYIRESGLEEKLELSPRTLIQSLMMSTATPMVDGNTGLPYPVIQQGAGLGNAFDAMNATSYVLVDGQPDGKVKAELGDDPERTGVYTFDYTLHNMTDQAQRYTLDAGVYTQNALQDEDGTWYADYAMTQLNALVTYGVNGKEVLPESGKLTGCDYNGDGKVNEADGQALLDYAVGKLETIENLDQADLNGDKQVTAYDAELFLNRLGKCTVDLPASGEVTVTVTVTLSEEDRTWLDEIFVNGAYIEAYVTAKPFATEEGVMAPAHSIPVLAYYGGWDEGNMFDRVTHTQLATHTNERDSYVPAGMFGASDYNYITVVHGDEPGTEYYLGGNPFATDEEYLAKRNALRSHAGDAVTGLNFCLIRSAGGLRAAITNVDTGERYGYEEFDHIFPAFYFPNYGSWQNYSQSVMPGLGEEEGWMVTDTKGNPLPEGTTVELMVQAAPEYYLRDGATVDWDTIDLEHSALSMPVTVDNTAPQLKRVSVGTETDPATGEAHDFVEAVALDNRYTAAVILLTPGGTKIVGRQSANQTEPGVEATVRLDVTGIYGSTFKLAVVDYAGNATYYNVNVSEPYAGPSATLYGATMIHGSSAWHRFASNTNYDYELLLETNSNIGGAAYGDGYLFYTADAPGSYSSQYYLYVVDYPSFENPIQIGKVSGSPYYQAPIEFMTYNTDDGYLYYIKSAALYRMDVADASEVKIAAINPDYVYYGLDYNKKDRCFYVFASLWEMGKEDYPAYIFKFAMPDEGGEVVTETVADLGRWANFHCSLTLDTEQNAAYLVRMCNLYSDLLTYEFDTNTLTVTGQLENYGGVFMPDEATADDNCIFRTEPTSIKLSANSLNVFETGTKTLTAQVGPWCLKDKSVVWSSDNEAVATVDGNGKVTGISEGTATITAVSALDETIAATCTVTVVGDSFTLQGVGVQDGKSTLFTYDLHSGNLTPGQTVSDGDGNALTVEAASDNNTHTELWVQDTAADEEGKGYRMHIIDPATGKSTYDSAVNSNAHQAGSLLLADMVYDNWNEVLLGVNGTGKLFFSDDPKTNDVGTTWFDVSSQCLAAVARGNTWQNFMDKHTMVYVLDVSGNQVIACDLYFSTFFGGWSVFMNRYTLDKALTYAADETGMYQDSLVYDFDTGTPILFHYTEAGTEVYALSLESSDMTANVIDLGTIDDYENVAVYAASYSGIAATVEETAHMPQGEQVLLHTAGEALPQGSTNVAGMATPKTDDGTVTVTLRAEEAAASGMLEIQLNEKMTLVSLESPAQLSSYQEEHGKVVFAYAGTEAIEKNGVVAVLRLKDVAEPTQIAVTETERGGKALSETTTIRIGCDGGEDCPSAAFTDLNPEAWYHAYTDYVLDRGLMVGVGNHQFAPHATVTRAMAATILYRLAGEPEVQEPATFIDVEQGHWYAKAVAWAEDVGIVKGMDANHFAPYAPATREQLATLLYRYAQYAGLDVSAKGDLNTFLDGAKTSAYAVEAMTWAVGAGLLVGDETGRLLPKDGGTRAQLATVITRFLAQ